ncbi:MAG TPA: GNAT family N-acetyltransferase [Solirubrobacteraceae bacterium]|jgi:GNAT superfamily N-acetyltransferase|nr:GNAT family N-acetyltransferase [Solirubrobacteraceae bacterium]
MPLDDRAPGDGVPRPAAVTVVDGGSLSLAELTAAFNDGYRGYLFPVALDDAAMQRHVLYNDIDLACSRVVIRDTPASLALMGRRGPEAWLGGMGTAPDARRQGLGERALTAALDAVAGTGVQTVWLEVLRPNQPAIALYQKLGFTIERELLVWTVGPWDGTPPGAVSLDLPSARAWISAHRESREPWQRTDATVKRMSEHGALLKAWAIERAGETAAVAIAVEDPTALRILQAAAIDDDAVAGVLRAVASAGRPVRVVNFTTADSIAAAYDALPRLDETSQYEMRLSL